MIVDATEAQQIASMLNALEDAGNIADSEQRWDKLREARLLVRETFREVTGWTLVRRAGRWLVRR